MARAEYEVVQTHTCGRQPLFLCLNCTLLILKIKAQALCHAYFIGCRWYLLGIYVFLFEYSILSTHLTSCQGWGDLKWHCGAPRIVIRFCDVKWYSLLMFSKEEIHQIKALQNKGVFLCMFESALPKIVYLSVRQSVCTLSVLVHVFVCTCLYACVCQCLGPRLHLKAISGFRSNGV